MRDALRSGDPVVGTWASLADPAVAELLAPDADFVMLDTEHTPNSLETVTDCARAVDAAPGDALPLARVPWNDPVRIKRVLDTGVAGVMVPMVESADEAAAAVEACRYPPGGMRGIAAARASDYGRNFEAYVETANQEVLTILQIETEAGVENAADIAAVEGVDALFVGPADLSANLGVFAEWSSPELREAIGTVLEAGETAGTPVGTLGSSPDEIRTLGSLGFGFLIAGVDTAMLLDGVAEAVGAARETLSSE
ncbi:HpcH/HpaI aldolase family protein [Haloglomus salinum]|jgi:2-keto-3-deoxy-L-rhamnonate aldolase RhmA|uniref:HpcH/HpaI aldolase family protein n=1 Tax=Haloglomus salinum TaxID=2962673 RepID=UPI0020C954E5|nr:aldolase/citrate lyase family protein [Haloglomus salinum]